MPSVRLKRPCTGGLFHLQIQARVPCTEPKKTAFQAIGLRLSPYLQTDKSRTHHPQPLSQPIHPPEIFFARCSFHVPWPGLRENEARHCRIGGARKRHRSNLGRPSLFATPAPGSAQQLRRLAHIPFPASVLMPARFLALVSARLLGYAMHTLGGPATCVDYLDSARRACFAVLRCKSADQVVVRSVKGGLGFLGGARELCNRLLILGHVEMGTARGRLDVPDEQRRESCVAGVEKPPCLRVLSGVCRNAVYGWSCSRRFVMAF